MSAGSNGGASSPSIELRELHAFLILSEELHFGRAAERLQIAPSYLSQRIRALEAKLGGPVFERTSRRVRLTPLGERLRGEIPDPLERLQSVLADVREQATGVAGVLRIGLYSPMSTGRHMTEIIRTFETRHPGCPVEFVNTGYERNYVEVLKSREVDLLATRLPLEDPAITIGPVLSRERRIAVVAEHDPLAQRESISYEDLADRAVSDIPSFPREMMDAFVPPVTPSGRVLKRIANEGAEDCLMRVALGAQVHPATEAFFDHHSHPGVTSVPIRDLPPSETALVWLTDNHSVRISAFVRAAEDVLARTSLGHTVGAMRRRTAHGPGVVLTDERGLDVVDPRPTAKPEHEATQAAGCRRLGHAADSHSRR
jgi:DNA-binding transcriptional LysR family regulator